MWYLLLKYIMAKRIVRLTESDLVRLVKRVINEDAFTFGDKVRSKLGKIVGLREKTPDEKQVANDIYNKVESGDFEVTDSMDGFVGKGYKISVRMDDGVYLVKAQKRKTSLEGPKVYSTEITTPKGGFVYVGSSGYTKKLMDLIGGSHDGSEL